MLIGVNCIKLFTQLSFDLRSSKMDSKNYNDSLAISQDHDGILQITVTAKTAPSRFHASHKHYGSPLKVA